MRNPVNVLLVDDTPGKLLSYEASLSVLGETLLKARSAQEAFEVLLRTDIAVVVTDVSMPNVDGFEFVKLLRSHPRYETIPVIFVSAADYSDVDKLRGYTSGAFDFMTAPVVPEVLRSKVKVFAELRRKQRELEALKIELERRVEERTAELRASTMRLAESEQRYRSLVDDANDVVATLDMDFRFTSVNPAIERVLGYAPAEIRGTNLGAYMLQDQLATSVAKQKLAGVQPETHEIRFRAKDGEEHTLEVSSRLLVDEAGNPTGIHTISRDITERKAAEVRQLIFMRELQHRTKNLLATIQSIATHTLSQGSDPLGAAETLVGRLHALARAQDLVVSGPNIGISLRDLVEGELRTHLSRARIDGAPLLLGSSFAQRFTLMLHELTTNAIRHGSLSGDRGHVHVTWSVEGVDDRIWKFAWREMGGPAVNAPSTLGFGGRLIGIALGENARISYNAEGLSVEAELPFLHTIQ